MIFEKILTFSNAAIHPRYKYFDRLRIPGHPSLLHDYQGIWCQVIYLLLMEKVGTGIKRMEKFCKEIGNTIEIKPLSTHFFVEMESREKSLTFSGING